MHPGRSSRVRPAAWLVAAAFVIATGRGIAAEEPLVTVKTVTDDTVYGRLIEFSLDSGLVLDAEDGDGPRQFPAGDVVHIVANRHPARRPAESVQLGLTGGDLLFGRVTGFANDLLTFESPTIGRIRVPLERVASWKTPAADDPRLAGAAAALAGRDKSATDVLLLTNGDLVRGFVAAIDEHGFVVEADLAESRVSHDAVAAATLVTADTAPDRTGRPAPLRAVVLTADGQRLTTSALDWSEIAAVATIFDRIAQRIPVDRIARIDVQGGRWEWLTALQPISYEHTPALSLDWGWRADRNVIGGPLLVTGQTFEHGLGVHSQCSITFDLMGAFSEFVTSMGLDDDSGPYANVDVEIRVDGQLRFSRQGITPGTLHGPLRLDVAGAKRIKLTVLFGRNADLQDRFNWVEAALIR